MHNQFWNNKSFRVNLSLLVTSYSEFHQFPSYIGGLQNLSLILIISSTTISLAYQFILSLNITTRSQYLVTLSHKLLCNFTWHILYETEMSNLLFTALLKCISIIMEVSSLFPCNRDIMKITKMN